MSDKFLLTYEEENEIADKVEREYKHEKGYDKISNWAYSDDDRKIIKRRVKNETLKAQVAKVIRVLSSQTDEELVEWVSRTISDECARQATTATGIRNGISCAREIISKLTLSLIAKGRQEGAREIIEEIEKRWGTPFEVELDYKWWGELKSRYLEAH